MVSRGLRLMVLMSDWLRMWWWMSQLDRLSVVGAGGLAARDGSDNYLVLIQSRPGAPMALAETPCWMCESERSAESLVAPQACLLWRDVNGEGRRPNKCWSAQTYAGGGDAARGLR